MAAGWQPNAPVSVLPAAQNPLELGRDRCFTRISCRSQAASELRDTGVLDGVCILFPVELHAIFSRSAIGVKFYASFRVCFVHNLVSGS